MTGFFAHYFQVLHHPGYVVTEMPLTALDHWIAFSPLWLVPYVSLWVFVLLPPILLTEPRELWSYAAASAALSGSGLLMFSFWPTTLPSMEIDWDRHPSVQFLKAVDASGNACPSLHVGFAVFTAVWLERLGPIGNSIFRGSGWEGLTGPRGNFLDSTHGKPPPRIRSSVFSPCPPPQTHSPARSTTKVRGPRRLGRLSSQQPGAPCW